MVKNIHDRQGIVSNIFGPYLIDLLLKIRDSQLEKCFFFLMGQNFTGGEGAGYLIILIMWKGYDLMMEDGIPELLLFPFEVNSQPNHIVVF